MPPDPEGSAGELRQKGFALIVVIWIGVLLALISAAFSSAVRSRLRSTATHAEILRAEAVANAGVRIALLERLDPATRSSVTPRFPVTGANVACSIGSDATIVIAVEDEEGKINLNTTNDKLLVALFAGLGANQDQARRYANRVMDFRDADNDKRLDGAERADYAKEGGLAAGPKDADFSSVEELDQVVGIPADIREKAKRFLTTFSTQNGIDPAVAVPELKPLLVRGSNGIVVPSEAADKKSDGSDMGIAPDANSIFISSELPSDFVSSSSRRFYTIRAEAILTSGARYVSDVAVIVPDGSAGQPIFQRWRRGQSNLPAGYTIPSPRGLRPC